MGIDYKSRGSKNSFNLYGFHYGGWINVTEDELKKLCKEYGDIKPIYYSSKDILPKKNVDLLVDTKKYIPYNANASKTFNTSVHFYNVCFLEYIHN